MTSTHLLMSFTPAFTISCSLKYRKSTFALIFLPPFLCQCMKELFQTKKRQWFSTIDAFVMHIIAYSFIKVYKLLNFLWIVYPLLCTMYCKKRYKLPNGFKSIISKWTDIYYGIFPYYHLRKHKTYRWSGTKSMTSKSTG